MGGMRIGTPLRRLGSVALLGGVAAGTSGCFLFFLLLTTLAEDGDVGVTFAGSFAAALCVLTAQSEADLISCSYLSKSGPSLASTSFLLSEFGRYGPLVDPVILQVPTPVSGVSATFDRGLGSEDLVVTETSSFDADAFRTVVAEPGTTFLIFELPTEVARTLPPGFGGDVLSDFDFQVSFTVPDAPPLTVKPMLALRIDVADRTFYMPQVPCVTDFAGVPEVTLPVPATAADLGALATAAFAGVTGCQGEFWDYSGVTLDHPHYVLWKARSDTKPDQTVSVTDARGTRGVVLDKTTLLGTPADRDNRDPTAPLSPEHLVGYKAKPAPGEPKEPALDGVQVANLLGVQTLRLKKADLVLLPAAKGLVGPVPPLGKPEVRPFHCWRARYARGSERIPKRQSTLVTDQFGSAFFTLKKPTHLCLPADVDGGATGAENDVEALLCVKARAQKPRPPGRDGVHTTDAVAPQVLRVRKPAEVCLPSTVQFP